MKYLPSVEQSLRIITWTFVLTIIYHLAIIFQFIPFEFVWGGRLTSEKEMYQFESVSLLLNIVFLVLSMTLLRKKEMRKKTVVKVIFYLFAVLFLMNTAGNMVAISDFEKYIFTPVTLIVALLCLRIAVGDKGQSTSS